MIEHFTSDPVGSLEKARRVLKEDGMLIVTTPNSLSAVNRVKRFLGQGNSLIYHRPMMVSGNLIFMDTIISFVWMNFKNY